MVKLMSRNGRVRRAEGVCKENTVGPGQKRARAISATHGAGRSYRGRGERGSLIEGP